MSQSKELEATQLGKGELPESKVLNHLGLVAGMFEPTLDTPSPR
jgi:hypothetical protein